MFILKTVQNSTTEVQAKRTDKTTLKSTISLKSSATDDCQSLLFNASYCVTEVKHCQYRLDILLTFTRIKLATFSHLVNQIQVNLATDEVALEMYLSEKVDPNY